MVYIRVHEGTEERVVSYLIRSKLEQGWRKCLRKVYFMVLCHGTGLMCVLIFINTGDYRVIVNLSLYK